MSDDRAEDRLLDGGGLQHYAVKRLHPALQGAKISGIVPTKFLNWMGMVLFRRNQGGFGLSMKELLKV